MLKIEIANPHKYKINKQLIKQIIKVVADQAGLDGKFSVSLMLSDEKEITEYNFAYRGKNKPTDVLSFAQIDSDICLPEEAGELGEIIICYPVLEKQASDYGWSNDYEFARLLIHGLSHLLGYEHEGVSSKIAKQMFDFEKTIIEQLSFA